MNQGGQTRKQKSKTALQMADEDRTFSLALYDGQKWFGSIIERDGQFIALCIDRNPIGAFASLEEAADAISAAASHG
jgi:hypothetical protein